MEELTFADLIDLELDWIVMVEMIEEYHPASSRGEVRRILLKHINARYREKIFNYKQMPKGTEGMKEG